MIEQTSEVYPMLFYVLATGVVATALCMIVFRNPIYSTLALILNFVGVSGIYILLNAQLLALINVIVYAGAIMVLFIFVLMLIHSKENVVFIVLKKNKWKTILVVLSVGGLLFSLVRFALHHVGGLSAYPIEAQTDVGSVEHLGTTLFTSYVFPFELTGILFLVALIGAVMLAKK